MALKELNLTEGDIDNLVLAWANLLSARDIDRFFWDYPGPYGYSSSGYGLGIDTAKRIVEHRGRRIGGFGAIPQLIDVPGVGPDKVSDMRIQAKEAFALAAYRSLARDPVRLWKSLYNEGPGIPLANVVKSVEGSMAKSDDYMKRYELADIGRAMIRMPFVALAWIQEDKSGNRESVEQFTRVRVKPWAFAVHGADNRRTLRVDYSGRDDCQFTIEREN